MLNLRSFIRKSTTINYDFHKIRCRKHAHRKQFCEFIIDKKKPKWITIHNKYYNYRVTNYPMWCSERKSKPFSILTCTDKIKLDSSSNAFINVDNQPIYKIRSVYITQSLLIHFNEISVNGKDKMIGMYVLLSFHNNFTLILN